MSGKIIFVIIIILVVFGAAGYWFYQSKKTTENNGTESAFDSTNATHLTYAQAMNLENYLYMAVTAFGLIQVTIANGAFMVIVGLAIAGAGFTLYRIGSVKS